METITALMNHPTLKQQCSDDRLQQIVALTFFRKGQQIESKALNLVVADFKSLLLRNFSYLTIEEIGYALESGVFGKYGAVYTISVVQLNQWIVEYVQSEERIQAIQKKNKLALPQKATITESQKKSMVNDFIINKFNDYKISKKLVDNFNIIYEKLSTLGILNPTKEEKNVIYKHFLAQEEENNKNRKPNQIMSLAQIVLWRHNNAKNTAVNKAKNYFVAKFFSDIINANNEIEDYI